MTELTNVDDLLLQEPVYQVASEPEQPPEMPPENQDDTSGIEEPPVTEAPKQDEGESLDDYGNAVPKTEPEDEMIPKSVLRERLERKNRETEQRIAEAEQRARDQAYAEMRAKAQSDDSTPDASGDWQEELKSLIRETQKEEQTQAAERLWRAEQDEIQSQFEVKFNSGAAKYKDFETVVMGKAITPQMAMATRGMENPAAFIYAAAKTQPQELERISKINDPYSQAIELGRLEERMKKARTNTSSAPKPVTPIRGDVSEKAPARNNIDDILIRDERDKLKGQRR